jgi:hypothetical protein
MPTKTLVDKNTVGAALAFIFALGFLAVLGILLFTTVNTANEKYLLIGLGSLTAFAGQGVQHFLGSSVGSAKKDEMLLRAPPSPEGPSGGPAVSGQ